MTAGVRRGRSGRSVFGQGRIPRGVAAGPVLRPCPKCDASAGMPCRKWKIVKGERVAIMGHLTTFHRERRASS